MNKKEISMYFSLLGKKGGKTTGSAKVRGDSSYYKKIAAKRKKVKK